jgi:predicted transcriptional regulator
LFNHGTTRHRTKRIGSLVVETSEICVTIRYVRTTLTISLPEDLNRALSSMVKQKGISRSQVVQDALRRQIALERFRDLRDRMIPKAGQAGFHTDEDVFKAIS